MNLTKHFNHLVLDTDSTKGIYRRSGGSEVESFASRHALKLQFPLIFQPNDVIVPKILFSRARASSIRQNACILDELRL